MSESNMLQAATTTNFDMTMYDLGRGKASRSFTVRSEYSRPNTQLATNPNPINPNAEIICARSPRYDGQSTFCIMDDFVPNRPIFPASSGFLAMNIKKPVIIAMNNAARMDSQSILDLRTFKLSAQTAADISVILRTPCANCP